MGKLVIVNCWLSPILDPPKSPLRRGTLIGILSPPFVGAVDGACPPWLPRGDLA